MNFEVPERVVLIAAYEAGDDVGPIQTANPRRYLVEIEVTDDLFSLEL